MTKAKAGPTAAEVRALFEYDPNTGHLRWRDARKDALSRFRAGFKVKDRYRAVHINRVRYFEHRIVWLWMTGKWPTLDIDHINQNGLDNRWWNLRGVSHQLNSQNQRFGRNGGLIGTDYFERTGRWRAAIRINGKKKHIGYFDTAEEAHDAYVRAKRIHHAGCTI